MPSKIITVRSSNELELAVEKLASGLGGTILLDGSSGPFGLDLSHNRERIDAPVHIRSLDPQNPATFSKLRTIERENLTVENVIFDSTSTHRSEHHRDVEFIASTGMTITGSMFHGGAVEALTGAPDQVKGATMAIVRDSTDVSLVGNIVEGYYHGITFMNSRDLSYIDNEMTRLQGDGIRIAGAQDLQIEGNLLHDMLGTSQDINHSDMIQFWGTNIRQNTERVTIRDNMLLTGEGPAYQMIFGRNEHKAHNDWLFQDIVIEGNLLHGAHHNMISVAQTQDMVIRHNTVLWNRDARGLLPGGEPGKSINGWVRAPDGHGAVIESNVAANIQELSGENAIVEYSSRANSDYFSKHFVNLSANGKADLRDLSLVPDSEWDGMMGAPMTWSSHTPADLQAVARVHRSLTDRSIVTLDAGLSRDASGRLDASDASYVWNFDDGTQKHGSLVSHDFRNPGIHRYTLEVRLSDGAIDRIDRTVKISDPVLLALSLQDEVRDTSTYGTPVRFQGKIPGDEGFILDGASRIEVARGAAQLHSLDQMALTLNFTPEGSTGGTLFELFGAMEGRLTGNGTLIFDITTTAGTYRVSTDPGLVRADVEQELRFIFDGIGNKLELMVDGELAATSTAFGVTKPVEYWGLVIGNVFGGTSAKGTVSNVSLHAEPYATPDRDDGEVDSSNDSEIFAHLSFDDGVQDISGNDARIEWDKNEVEFVLGSDGFGRAVKIGGRGDSVTLSRDNTELFDREEFHIAFDLRRDEGGDGGCILQLYRTLDLSLMDDGRLKFTLLTDEGEVTALSEDRVLTGTNWRHVELSYDGEIGITQVVVDGKIVAEAKIAGSTAPVKYWGLDLGRSWGGQADGAIDEFLFYEDAFIREEDDPDRRAGVTTDNVETERSRPDETTLDDEPTADEGSLTSLVLIDACESTIFD